MVVELPSPETYVRFVSKRTGKVLADDNELCHTDKDPAKAEHWWRIIPANGQTNSYIIKNVTTGRVIWCRSKNRRAGCIDDDGKWADNWFVFEETRLPNCNGTFRIHCPSANCALASRTDKKPEVDGILLKDDGSPDNEDQHFLMNFEDMGVESIEYDIKAGKKSSEKPAAIAQQDLENASDTEQIQTFTYNEDKAEEHTFEHSHGFEISISQKIKVQAWPIWTGKLEVKGSTKNEWRWGEKNTVTTKWGISQALKVPKNSTFVATLTATKMEISVPFKMIWKAKDSGAKNTTYGMYTGVSYYNASTTIKPKSGTSGTSYKDESRTFEDGTENIEGNATGEEQVYPVDNEQTASYETYGNETLDGTKQNYDGQGSFGENQDYDNSEEKEEETGVEPGYEENQYFQGDYDNNGGQGGDPVESAYENKPYEENYGGDEGRQSNEANFDETSYNQLNGGDDPYNTGYQQNEPQEIESQARTSYEPETEELTFQSTYSQNSYEGGNSYEERQDDQPEVENLSLEDSKPIYQDNTDSYSGGYDQQSFDNNCYESNQFNNESTEQKSSTLKYQNTSRSDEDESFNQQGYSQGRSFGNVYVQSNDYDQSSKPTYEENTFDQAVNYEQPSEDRNSYGHLNNYGRNKNFHDQSSESTYNYRDNIESSYGGYE
ncbi:660d8779-a622-4dc7-91d5-182039511358 [Sclerotinia trifoliorum]|uniref:660d8779-a622-4dc7-91d5-182039511358 n=1 Tax=Sclerotinia trifoliorum TaxID=28548 RepID=A0A8H2VZ63_9HELO|nr:660d8779-a622-4dc7-91d5-182039511358 [Sclerotinia trifoliorum]